MTDVKQIFSVIQGLPVRDRLWLVERIAHDLMVTSTSQMAPPPQEQAPSLLGLFADEPDLIDEVRDRAMEARRKDPLRTNGGGDESDP